MIKIIVAGLVVFFFILMAWVTELEKRVIHLELGIRQTETLPHPSSCQSKTITVYEAAKPTVKVALYSDSTMKTPLPNPFQSNCDGSAVFYPSIPEISVQVYP